MLPKELEHHIPAFAREWFLAEEALKELERLEAKVFMASVQELRYAGRRVAHILQVVYRPNPPILSSTDLDSLKTHILEATENCIKARHDAVDAAVHFIHKRIDTLVAAVGLHEVRAHFPAFNSLENEIKEIDKKIVASRANRETLTEQYTAILKEHAGRLTEFYVKLRDSELAIRKALRAKEQIDSRKNLKYLAMGLLGGFLLGIVASLIAAYFDRVIQASLSSSTPATPLEESRTKPPPLLPAGK